MKIICASLVLFYALSFVENGEAISSKCRKNSYTCIFSEKHDLCINSSALPEWGPLNNSAQVDEFLLGDDLDNLTGILDEPDSDLSCNVYQSPTNNSYRCCYNKICSPACDLGAKCIDGECKCEEGYERSGNSCTAYCEAYNVTRKSQECFGVFSFSKAFVYQTVYSLETCGGRSMASIKCTNSTRRVVEFAEDTFRCIPCDITLKSYLKQGSPAVKSTEDLSDNIDALQLLTSNSSAIKDQAEDVVTMLEKLKSTTQTANSTVRVTASTLSNVLVVAENLQTSLVSKEKNTKEPEKNENIMKPKQKLMKVIEDFARAVVIPKDEGEVSVYTEKLAVTVIEPNVEETVVFEPRSYVPESPGPRRKTIKLVIPPRVLKEMKSIALDYGSPSLRLVLVLHQDSSLLTTDSKTGQVIQASYVGNDTNNIPFESTFTMEHHDPVKVEDQEEAKEVKKDKNTLLEVVFQYKCVFWDFIRQDWSGVGCEFKRLNEKYLCECNHFTSFALLMRLAKVTKVPDPDPVTQVTCSLSVICLFITITIYLAVHDLRVRRPTPIMVNICICLLLGYVFFLAGADEVNSIKFCYVFALLMHLALLCSWFWSLIYSLNIHQALVKVVGKNSVVGNKVFMYLFGYGMPLLIVFIDATASLTLDGKLYEPWKYDGTDDIDFDSNYRSRNMCWIQKLSLYLAFLTPVVIILLINIIIFYITIRKLTWKRREIQSSREKASVKQQLLMAVTMISMMGLTWTFGILLFLSKDIVYQKITGIVFNLFNTTQGIVIFVMSCIKQEAVRDLWLSPILKFFGCDECKKKKEYISTTSESRSTTQTGALSIPRSSTTNTTAF